MSYEVLHSHPLTLVCFNIFVHYLFLIRWLIRGIILHLQYSDGISHSMNQLLGASSFWYVNNRFRSCDLNFGSGPVMTLSTKWCSVMNLFHWIHFWRVPWRVMSFLHFHFLSNLSHKMTSIYVVRGMRLIWWDIPQIFILIMVYCYRIDG